MHLYGRPNLPPRPLLVVDEAHTLVSQLESFYDLRLSMRRLVRLLAGSESTKKQKTALKEQWAFPEIKSMKPDTSMETRHKDIIQFMNDESPWEVFDDVAKKPRGQYKAVFTFWWESNFPEDGSALVVDWENIKFTLLT